MKGLPLFGLIVGLLSFVSAHAAAPVVTNIRAAQRSGTQLVDIYYNLSASANCTVYVAISNDGG